MRSFLYPLFLGAALAACAPQTVQRAPTLRETLAAWIDRPVQSQALSSKPLSPEDQADRAVLDRINAAHSSPDAARFAILQTMDCRRLWGMAAQPNASFYPSSFGGVFAHMAQACAREGLSPLDLVLQESRKDTEALGKPFQFFTNTGYYGKGATLLPQLRADQIEPLTALFFGTIARAIEAIAPIGTPLPAYSALMDWTEAVALAPGSQNQLKAAYFARLVQAYHTADAQGRNEVRRIYGLALARAAAQGVTDPAVRSVALLNPLPRLPVLDEVTLFPAKTHTMIVRFFNDDDGQSSYAALRGKLGNGWRLSDKETYVEAQRQGPAGRKLVMLITKPSTAEAGFAAIRARLDANGTRENSVVFRGHYYHTHPEDLPQDTRPVLVFSGGCGSTAKTYDFMKRNPDILPFTARTTGRSVDNDALLLSFAEQILDTGSLSYPRLATNARQRGASLEDYVMPPDDLYRMIAVGLMQSQRRTTTPDQRPRLDEPNF